MEAQVLLLGDFLLIYSQACVVLVLTKCGDVIHLFLRKSSGDSALLRLTQMLLPH